MNHPTWTPCRTCWAALTNALKAAEDAKPLTAEEHSDLDALAAELLARRALAEAG